MVLEEGSLANGGDCGRVRASGAGDFGGCYLCCLSPTAEEKRRRRYGNYVCVVFHAYAKEEMVGMLG